MPVAKYVYACFLLGFLKYPEKSQTCRTLSLTYTAGTFFVVEWFKNAARLRFVHCNVKSKSVFPFFFSVCYRQSDATTASWQPVRIQLPPCFEPVTNATGPRFVRCLGLFMLVSNIAFISSCALTMWDLLVFMFLFPKKIMTILIAWVFSFMCKEQLNIRFYQNIFGNGAFLKYSEFLQV